MAVLLAGLPATLPAAELADAGFGLQAAPAPGLAADPFGSIEAPALGFHAATLPSGPAPALLYALPPLTDGLVIALGRSDPLDGLVALGGEDATDSALFGAYGATFGGLDFSIGAGAATTVGNDRVWQAGARLGLAGFVFGVALADGTGALPDTLAFGASYDTGPWSFAGGLSADMDGGEPLGWGLQASYALSPTIRGTLALEGQADGLSSEPETALLGYLRVGF
jgi:hypothetical protein